MSKICSICKEEFPDLFFNFRVKSENKRRSSCKNCTRKWSRRHHKNNLELYRFRRKLRKCKVKVELQNYILGYLKENPCVDCGESDPVVLEFDHREPKNKEYGVSRLISGCYNLEIIIKEIAKCDVRCANCHRRKTMKDVGCYRIIQ